jgi:hypothetical protein
MEGDRFVQAVLNRVSGRYDRMPFAPSVAEDEGDDRGERERETDPPDQDLVARHQKRVQNPA